MKNLTSLRATSIIGGIGYIVIFITGIYANFFVLEKLMVLGNPTETFQNFTGNTGLLKTAIISFITMVMADLVLTWVLFVLFKSRFPNLSTLTAWFRLVNVAVFGIALFYLLDVYSLVGDCGTYALASTDYLSIETYRALEAFNQTWLLGLVFFGIHLLLLAVLIMRSSMVPKFIGVLLALAGFGYVLDSMLQFVYVNYSSIKDISAFVVILPGVVGELSLTIWLLARGGKENKKHTQGNG